MSDLYSFFFYLIPECGNRFVVTFTVSEICEDLKSYFNGLKIINIGPYVK
jgi:hypothetical protein